MTTPGQPTVDEHPARAPLPLHLDWILIGGSLLFSLVVHSGFFARSEWMLGGLAYHRGVAYTMAAGSLQGEGPYPGFIAYDGGLYPLATGLAAVALGVTFDAVVSVASWVAGPAWVLATLVLARRLWPADAFAGAVFVALAAAAAPFTYSDDLLWVESVLATSHSYWPLYPRDVALILLVLVAAAALDQDRRRRVVLAGGLVGVMALFHLQLTLVTCWLLAAWSVWVALRDRRRTMLTDLVAMGLIALVVSAWWWLPRVGPTLSSGGILLGDHPERVPLQLTFTTFLEGMGMVGALSLVGFPALAARRFGGPGSRLILVWAAALLPLIAIDRAGGDVDLFTERQIWLLFSVPATVAAAFALTWILRSLPRIGAAVLALVIAASFVPGTPGILHRIGAAWPDGQIAGASFDPTVLRPIWDALRERNQAEGGLVVGTYDAYATWTWSFSGAQVVSLWLPGYFRLGFDPEAVTGLGFRERADLLERSFRGPAALCANLVPAGASVLLLDRLDNKIALFDRSAAMASRVDPRDRPFVSVSRTITDRIVYEDRNAWDYLLLKAGATYDLDWVDPGITELVIEADLGIKEGARAVVDLGPYEVRLEGSAGRQRFVIPAPRGGLTGLSIRATRSIQLFRISGFMALPGLEGPDGPFLVDAGAICPVAVRHRLGPA